MRLIIAEKPTVGRGLAQLLPVKASYRTHIDAGDDVVTWCARGHMYEQAAPHDYDPSWKEWTAATLPLIPSAWKLVPKADAREQIAVIRDLLKKADSVVNLGDPDREGQLIVDELLDQLGNRKPVTRLWLAALDETSIRKALASMRPNEEYQNLRHSAEARQRADWLVGLNLTRAYTIAAQSAGYQGTLSIGRVQTPTLALVVGRDREIENFSAKDFYVLDALLASPEGRFSARWRPGDSVPVDEAKRLLDPSLARAVAAKIEGKAATVTKGDAAEKTEAPPLPYSLDILQAEANRRFGYTPKKVLDAVQELYELKLTTYPRTDCSYLPESMFAEAGAVLDRLGAGADFADLLAAADKTRKSAAWNDEKVTAHHAIIPTGEHASLDEKSAAGVLYRMIVGRYVTQFMRAHRYEKIELEVLCEGERFTAEGRKTIEDGWKAFAAPKEAAADPAGGADEDPAQTLPYLKTGTAVRCDGTELKAKKTTPPPHFTEGTLVEAMCAVHRFVTDPKIKKLLKETSGIGTVATRAPILETLKARGFLVPRRKYIVSSEVGRSLIDAVPTAIKSPGLTALFEQSLQAIAEGAKSADAFVQGQTEFVRKYVQAAFEGGVKMPLIECPVCKEGHLRRRTGTNGDFWGCSRFKDGGCKATYPDKGGKPDFSPKAHAKKGLRLKGERSARPRRARKTKSAA